jgi:hypothetical protein
MNCACASVASARLPCLTDPPAHAWWATWSAATCPSCWGGPVACILIARCRSRFPPPALTDWVVRQAGLLLRVPAGDAGVENSRTAKGLARAQRDGVSDAAPQQRSGWVAVLRAHWPQNWHQTGASQVQKAKKSAGANLPTLANYGSPTWARTRDLRINSHIRKVEESGLSC